MNPARMLFMRTHKISSAVDILKAQNVPLFRRWYSDSKSKIYTEKDDPASLFLNKEVQSFLRVLTRKDLSKVYRKKKLGQEKLEKPVYKFMTDEELQEVLNEANKKADEFLQMPPVLPARNPVIRVLSRDPALQGLDTARFVFTDITFGVPDSKRVVVVREPDGTLKEAEWELRDRMNQLYFPRVGRELTPPRMFEDSYLSDLLNRHEYEFILDRACIQFEPDDANYQKVCSATYEHINENNGYNHLRSTRHFGPFVFYLAWHKNIDNLLLELIETCNADEASKLVSLYGKIHNVEFKETDMEAIIKEYITGYSEKKGPLELAYQAYKDVQKQRKELEGGIRAAHGN